VWPDPAKRAPRRPPWRNVTGDADERFRRDYAPAFLQYLSEGGEPGRRAAYELGRRAISERLSILDLARIHHTVLLDVLKTHRTPHELEHIARAASEFLVEALAVFEMTQRGFTELLSADRTHQDQLRELQDLEQRMAIEQAKGMLMERHGLSAGSAEERIRQMAARQGITVDEVAARLGQPPSRRQRRSGR
jgi:ANTAR domain/Phosphoserine phosphatase RsbU, N-terminal domain